MHRTIVILLLALLAASAAYAQDPSKMQGRTTSTKAATQAAQSDFGSIRVVSGFYGRNCHAKGGNKTRFLAKACNGKQLCKYKVDYTVIGDPAVGCRKDYVAKWTCGEGTRVHFAKAPAEAGYGSVVKLACRRPPNQPEGAK